MKKGVLKNSAKLCQIQRFHVFVRNTVIDGQIVQSPNSGNYGTEKLDTFLRIISDI